MEMKWWILIAIQHLLIWLLTILVNQYKNKLDHVDKYIKDFHVRLIAAKTWQEAEDAVESLCNTFGIKTKDQS